MVEGWMTKLSLAHAKKNSKRDTEDTLLVGYAA